MSTSARVLPVTLLIFGLAIGFLVGRRTAPKQDEAKPSPGATQGEQKDTANPPSSTSIAAPQSPSAIVRDLIADKDPTVRMKAIELLSAWQPLEIKDSLPSILENEKDPGCLLVALAVAGKLANPETFDAIELKLKSKDVAVKRRAASTLGELAELMEKEDRNRAAKSVRDALQREISDARTKKRKLDAGAYLPYLTAMSKLNGDISARELIKHLRLSRHPMVRRWAANSLKGIVTEEHATLLKAAWRSESDPSVRNAIELIIKEPPFNTVVDRKRMSLVPAKGPSTTP